MIDFNDHAAGLDTEVKRRVNQMLGDYDPNLSLRRIAPEDPYFTAEKPYGVWERLVSAGQANWVFTLSESMIDARVLAMVAESDMKRNGVEPMKAKQFAFAAAQKLAQEKEWAEYQEERAEMARTFAAVAKGRHGVRVDVDGDATIFSDDPAGRRVRSFIS